MGRKQEVPNIYTQTVQNRAGSSPTKTTVKLSGGETVKQSSKTEKTSFYISSEQREKLDDLAHDYGKVVGRRLDRQDVIRYLIDRAAIEDLEGL